MLQEPLLVVGAFYILFFTVIVYVRLDFSITKVQHEEEPLGMLIDYSVDGWRFFMAIILPEYFCRSGTLLDV